MIDQKQPGDQMEPTEEKKSVESLSEELLNRLSRDDEGPPATAASHQVGRLVKSCAALEELLRAVLVEVANHAQLSDPRTLLARANGKPPRVDRATAGELAHGLSAFAKNNPRVEYPLVFDPLFLDLLHEKSVILTFINIRNGIAKRDDPPEKAKEISKELKNLVIDFRRHAGWKR